MGEGGIPSVEEAGDVAEDAEEDVNEGVGGAGGVAELALRFGGRYMSCGVCRRGLWLL